MKRYKYYWHTPDPHPSKIIMPHVVWGEGISKPPIVLLTSDKEWNPALAYIDAWGLAHDVPSEPPVRYWTYTVYRASRLCIIPEHTDFALMLKDWHDLGVDLSKLHWATRPVEWAIENERDFR